MSDLSGTLYAFIEATRDGGSLVPKPRYRLDLNTAGTEADSGSLESRRKVMTRYVEALLSLDFTKYREKTESPETLEADMKVAAGLWKKELSTAETQVQAQADGSTDGSPSYRGCKLVIVDDWEAFKSTPGGDGLSEGIETESFSSPKDVEAGITIIHDNGTSEEKEEDDDYNNLMSAQPASPFHIF